MFFDDPQNALSVARTHQQELLQEEQRDRLARQAQPARTGPSGPGLSSWWQIWHAVGFWLKTRLTKRSTAPVRQIQHMPK